ncbi:MAG: DUF4352 domain-containing protein [Lachnospiraceae bacterium]|nr:DUF4352 domain-containing protein [Lachnospiraceae bacterium]MDE6185811.1 DUF4352 domain-containing protein [Lachnospiraceae bacterium]MDE7285269.1 DUF4352 domain-containing protein [Lachnospiraceae bacterium]
MKKFSYALAGVALAICLVGCGNVRSVLNRESEETKESEEREESEETQEIKESLFDRESEEEASDVGGYSEGRMGDTMKTYFFDYTVNSAYVCEEFEGFQPAEGKDLLVADVTVKNTFNESIPMFDSDFQIQWNSDAEEDYDVPISYYGNEVSDEQLPESYELSINEEKTGLLVFEVPEGEKDFSISYLELFDDDSEGDVYFVFFTAEKQ